MTVEEFRKKLIEELEPAYFVGGFGGAMLEMEEIRRASKEKIKAIARKQGIILEEDEEKEKPKEKRF